MPLIRLLLQSCNNPTDESGKFNTYDTELTKINKLGGVMCEISYNFVRR